MPVYRYDMLLQLTTSPTQAGKAIAHSGGWSESHWRADLLPPSNVNIQRLLNARAACLPRQAAMIGLRIGTFTLAGNKVLPGPTSITRFLKPGGAFDCDVPQMGLELSGSTGGANSSRFTMRGIPDAQVVNGEYAPSVAFKNRVQEYMNSLSGNNWAMLGRVLSNPTYRIVGITGLGVATFTAAPAVAVGDYMRLLRTKDEDQFPVEGAFYVSAVVGNTVTYANFPAVVVRDSGNARKDEVAIYSFLDVNTSRVVVRKVGRPFEQYRGRRSKRRVRAA